MHLAAGLIPLSFASAIPGAGFFWSFLHTLQAFCFLAEINCRNLIPAFPICLK